VSSDFHTFAVPWARFVLNGSRTLSRILKEPHEHLPPAKCLGSIAADLRGTPNESS
jgi:hypothetical protein